MSTTRKRSLSPAAALIPQAKRREGLGVNAAHALVLSGFVRLYDELILYIFSHLSYTDLCAAQATNRNWSRLASDNHLWKTLYLRAFGRTRLRGARGFVERADGREVRSLPYRTKTRSSDDLKDWKWMFRISSNWRRGRCNIEQMHAPAQDVSFNGSVHRHVLIAGPLVIYASSQTSPVPSIYIHRRKSPIESHVVTLDCPSSSNSPSYITTLALDQSPPHFGSIISTVVFLSTGEFIVYHLNHSDPAKSTRKYLYTPAHAPGLHRNSQRTAPIIQAVYHHPLLISLSQSFQLSIYDLSNDGIRHVQTLTSFSSFPPTSFVLSTPTPSTYKLVMAYAIPVYPSHWSVGATELIISSHPPSVGSSNAMDDYLAAASQTLTVGHSGSAPLTVVSTRTARAVDIPLGFVDTSKLRLMREQWSRKVPRVADTQTDGKWIVLAPAPKEMSPDTLFSPLVYPQSSSPLHSSTTLQLYRLSLPSSSYRSSSSAIPKISFVRYLEGQTSPVCSLALADGRCVSLGMNGSVWVWDLENGTGAQVAPPSSIPQSLGWQARPGSVVFDDRRIITADSDGVVVRRFDI